MRLKIHTSSTAHEDSRRILEAREREYGFWPYFFGALVVLPAAVFYTAVRPRPLSIPDWPDRYGASQPALPRDHRSVQLDQSTGGVENTMRQRVGLCQEISFHAIFHIITD